MVSALICEPMLDTSFVKTNYILEEFSCFATGGKHENGKVTANERVLFNFRVFVGIL